ncbi:39S ribosomal protein L52, mitochondrial [Galendromus occidentalis]|uniref:Large ribosomal subunit protein mL52 n=1 Tax=Galendromus occidentalis TaxID=34638 RepID=A0AAJ6QXL5_9ACAR|nr:39S ribosomal protein L52, mitochondrial [Galendromus occidentalis]
MLTLIGRLTCSGFSSETTRALHTTVAVSAGARYRASRREERFMNQWRVFADAPDWSRLDGTPAPLNNAQRRRYLQQLTYNQRVQMLLSQVDGARAAVQEAKEKIETDKKRIIANKLKSKAKTWTS